MQAEENTTTGIELDESVSFEDNELDEGTPFNGSELDEDTQADAAGVELDESVPSEGNEKDEGTPISGSELDEDTQADAAGVELDESIPAEGNEKDEGTPISGSELDEDTQADAAGIELDESVPAEGDELDEGTSFSGSELDEDTQADAAGIELDESIPVEGNGSAEAAPFNGSELDDDVPEATDGTEDPIPADPTENEAADEQADQDAVAETPVSGNRKKMLIGATAGLCTLALGAAAMYGTLLRPVETAAPPSTPIAITTKSTQDFEDFVIPFHRESNHYISLSISLESADGAVLHELKKKEAIFRGRIYDLLKAYAEQAAGHPSLAVAKEMVSDSINVWLSAGHVDGVYITRFVIK